jgi:serine/threonine protein kinase
MLRPFLGRITVEILGIFFLCGLASLKTWPQFFEDPSQSIHGHGVAKLIIQSGPGIGSDQAIADKLVVGRLQSCDLQIQEGKSSRQHFQIERIGLSFQLKDLGSRNGTELNEEPVTAPVLLSNGDVIQVGGTRLVFFLDAPKLGKGDMFAGYKILSAPIPSAYGYRFRARQRSLDREVVLETLALDYGHKSDIAKRFTEMMTAASQFDHPNILDIYEVGEEDKIPFATMPAFEGTTLRRVVRSGDVALADGLKILVHVADALVHINNRKKIHGRISPSSVLVSDGDYRIKLVGFGIDPRGRCTDPALPEAEWHAGFCSPEVGRGLEATPASDLYSLGAVAYWLVTGHVPYQGENAMDVLRQHAAPSPVVPAKDLMPELAPMIGRAIDRLLKKSAKERPENSRAAKKLMENALELAREKPSKISKIHSQPRGIPKISTDALDKGDSDDTTRTPNQTTVQKKRRKTASNTAKDSARSRKKSPSSERTRKDASNERVKASSSRLKVAGGISDRLVSPDSVAATRRGKGNSLRAWAISLVFVVLLYVGSYFVTRILMKFAEAN